MNEAVYLDKLQDEETNYWYNYLYGKTQEEQEIPDWYEEEQYEKFREEWGL